MLRTYFSPLALRNFILVFTAVILILMYIFTSPPPPFFGCVLLRFGTDATFYVFITFVERGEHGEEKRSVL